MMVVTGGLSGGISSIIAGGNFWRGVRQGLITSGLNHMAHLAGEEFNRISRTRQEIRDIGLNPDDVAPNTCDSVDKILTTKTLSDMNTKAGNPGFIFDDTMNPKHGAVTESYIEEKRVNPIRINSKIERTYYKLYSHIGHELVHAIDTVSGNRLQIFNQFIKNGFSDATARKYSGYWSESNAYRWNMKYTPDTHYNQWYKNFTSAFSLFQLK